MRLHSVPSGSVPLAAADERETSAQRCASWTIGHRKGAQASGSLNATTSADRGWLMGNDANAGTRRAWRPRGRLNSVRSAGLELVLPASLDGAGLVALLSDRLELGVSRPRTLDRVLLDTFDGRLRAAGLSAELTAPRTLSVREPGAPPRTAEVAPAARHLLEELPPGPVRDRLAGVLGVRALLPLVRVQSTMRPLAVLNGDAKTVVRLELEQSEVVGEGVRPSALAPRLWVRPVLGYDNAFERVARQLTGELGLASAPAPLLDEAVALAGVRCPGASSKPGAGLARGTPAHEAAGTVLLRLADMAAENLAGTLEDLDTEFLHDLRVSVRRARSVLRQLRGVFPPAERARLRDELRWVQALTGPVRDLDVQLLEWDELTGWLPPDRRADLAPLHRLVSQRRRAALRALRRGLRGRRFAAVLDEWRALAPAGPPGPGVADDQPRAELAIEAVAGDRIRSVYRRMVRDGLLVDDESPEGALHDLRKRGKELRYLLELFGGLYPSSVVKPAVSALKGLQDVLGRFQDRAVQADLLGGLGEELAAERGGPQALMALGLVVEALLADQAAAREEFAERFGVFASPRRRPRMNETFARLATA
jgi:CHAD domain-containing protein